MPNPFKNRIPARKDGFVPLSAAIPLLSPYWGIDRHYAQQALAELERVDFRAHAEEFAAFLPTQDDSDGTDAPYDLDDNGVATVRIDGVLMKRPSSWGRNTSYVQLRHALRQAKADERVKAVALVIDSPGGNVDGAFDAANDVFALRQDKPVGAYVDGCGCSAAYLLASQASFIYLGEGAMTANCGVVTAIADTSAAAKAAGVEVIPIRSAPLKGIGTAGAPISKADVAEIQRHVNQFNALFKASVGRGRGSKLSPARLNALFDARMRIGADAVAVGAADKVATLDEFYARLGDPDGAEDELQDEAQRSEGEEGGAGADPAVDDGGDGAPDAGKTDPPHGSDDSDDDDEEDGETESRAALQTEVTVNASAPAVETGAFLTQTADSAKSGIQEKRTMPDSIKEKFAAALSAIGLGSQSVAVMAAKDETPDAIVAAIVQQAKADADLHPAPVAAAPAHAASFSQRAANERDILTAAKAAGITTSAELNAMLENAKLGETYAMEVRERAKQEAIRVYGAQIGVSLHEQCDKLPVMTVKAMSDGWTAEADKKYGIGNRANDGKRAKDGAGAQRASAPQAVAVTVESDAEGEPASHFAKLTAEQKRTVTSLAKSQKAAGTLEEKCEALAQQLFGMKEGN